MHTIEPHYSWMHLYMASEDQKSPLYQYQNNETSFTHVIYNHYIHPQWDDIGSSTLFIKILYCNYDDGFTVIELMGEWNDCLHNDIMLLKRNIIEPMIENGINQFILIGENVLDFHYSDEQYYQEWYDEIENGWIVGINFRKHVKDEFEHANITLFIDFWGTFNEINWRNYNPLQFYLQIKSLIQKRLGT